MTISERLFQILEEKEISVPELSRMTGISRFTIFDWKRRNTNPGSDKIMVICEALQIAPEELLIGKAEENRRKDSSLFYVDDIEAEVAREFHDLSENNKRRLLAYLRMLQNNKEQIKQNQNPKAKRLI